MSRIDSIVNDMISNNNSRDECENCGRPLYVHGAQFCSMKCEKEFKSKNKVGK
jgi:hypothetical protein